MHWQDSVHNKLHIINYAKTFDVENISLSVVGLIMNGTV